MAQEKPEIVTKLETLYAVVKMGKKNRVMPFPPNSPMYHDVIASGIGFRTEKFCQQFLDESSTVEKKCRDEEKEFLKQKDVAAKKKAAKSEITPISKKDGPNG